METDNAKRGMNRASKALNTDEELEMINQKK